MSTEYPHAIDLCSGCGGASYGMQSVGFNVRHAFDINRAAWYTYKVHIGDHDDMIFHLDDIRDKKVTPEKKLRNPEKIKLVFAGPPCQPFSSAGQEDKDDDRRSVATECVAWICEIQPVVAVIENVDGLKDNNPEMLQRILDTLRDNGFQTQTVRLNAAEYRVPQKRSRVFILAVREDHSPPDVWKPPTVRSEDPGQIRLNALDETQDGFRTTGEALESLPDAMEPHAPKDDKIHMVSKYDENKVTPHACGQFIEQNGEKVKMWPNHIAADHAESTRERMAEFPLGYTGSSTTKRRLHPDEASPTITVSNGTPPVHYQGAAPNSESEDVSRVRRLTVREVARLQTFPDHWCFAGTKTDRFRLVGNAVPPLLAAHITGHLREEVLEGEEVCKVSQEGPHHTKQLS